jgi:hypothetical protein
VVISLHEYSFPKKGGASVGVARRWNPATGRTENSQVGVFLTATTEGVSCLLDARLYLPASWCNGTDEIRRRRERTRVPLGTGHRTKAQIGLDLLRRCFATGFVVADWVAIDRPSGDDAEMVAGLAPYDRHFLVAVPPTEPVSAADPEGRDDGTAAGAPPPAPYEAGSTAFARERVSRPTPGEAPRPSGPGGRPTRSKRRSGCGRRTHSCQGGRSGRWCAMGYGRKGAGYGIT